MVKTSLLKNEQEHQKKAFECYYALGEKRSHGRVATQLNVAASTIKLWARSFDWSGRLQERDADVARQIADKAIQSSVDEQGRNHKIVQMALVRLAKAIADGKVRMQLGDLERLIRLQASLEPPRSEMTVEGIRVAQTVDELEDFMDEYLSRLPEGLLEEAIKTLEARFYGQRADDES